MSRGRPWKASGADVCAVFCWTAGLAREGGVGTDKGAHGGERRAQLAQERARGAGGLGVEACWGEVPAF